MQLSRTFRALQRSSPNLSFSRKITLFSNNCEAATQAVQPKVNEEKFDFETILLDRTERRKPAIPPFMKEVFVSKVNTDLFAFPEILDKEEFKALDDRVKTVDNIMQNIKSTDKKDVAIQFKSLNSQLIGLPLKISDGGLGALVTERIRFLETVSSNLDVGKALSNHWVGLKCIEAGLHNEHFQKILPDLLSGESTISICTKEPISTRATQADFKTTALLDAKGIWRINGEKVLRDKGRYIITLCVGEASRLKLFLIHPDAQGIEYKENTVCFRDVPATILTEASDGQLTSILAMARLDTAVLSYSFLRRLMSRMTEYVRGKFLAASPLAEVATIRSKMADALLSHYAAESMVYFTAGLLDGYEKPDADLEVALCRLFTSEHVMDAILKLLSIPGLEGLEREWSGYLDEYRSLDLKDEIKDTVHTYAALTGLQHAGKYMAQEVKQLRNPVLNPGTVFRKLFSNRHQEADNPKLNLHLEEFLHPALRQPSEGLEYCVARLGYACEQMMTNHGMEVFKALNDLERLSKAAMEIYATISVLSRASRAYCIGLRNGEMEMKLSATYAQISKDVVKRLILDITNGEYINLDHFKLEFGRKVLDTNSVLVEKPIERVWW